MKTLLKDTDFLSSILETMSEGLMVVDRDGNILFFNKAAEGMTGFRMDEVLGRQCTILDTNTCVVTTANGKRKDCKLFDSGCVSNKKCIIKAKDGRVIHLLKNATVLRDKKGKITGAVEVMTDITSIYMKELEVEKLKSELMQEYGFSGIIGKSPSMMRLFEQIRNASETDASVIIHGESGVGKELVANAIHRLSKRSKGPFIKVNCAALNEYLLESELFGHVKGAFTGAFKDRMGRFEAAHKGTIFMDEIGDMPNSVQIKILRVLQEREIERVGEHKPISVDVRFITATNKDIEHMVAKGQFREDLFYRINVIPIRIAPLRERREDILPLLSHYLKKINIMSGRNIKRISPAAMEMLQSYHWPGNVRQLINAVEYASMTSRGDTIDISDLPEYIFTKTNMTNNNRKDFRKAEQVISALERFNWNRTQAARHLGISRVTLWKLMKEFKIKEKK